MGILEDGEVWSFALPGTFWCVPTSHFLSCKCQGVFSLLETINALNSVRCVITTNSLTQQIRMENQLLTTCGIVQWEIFNLAVLWLEPNVCDLQFHGVPTCLHHFGAECSHSFSVIQGSWWASLAVNPSVPWGMLQAKPMAEMQLATLGVFSDFFREMEKKNPKCLFCLPANSTGAFPGDVLPANHFAVKQPGAKIPWLLFFHTELFTPVAGEKQGLYSLCWFGFFSWCTNTWHH